MSPCRVYRISAPLVTVKMYQSSSFTHWLSSQNSLHDAVHRAEDIIRGTDATWVGVIIILHVTSLSLKYLKVYKLLFCPVNAIGSNCLGLAFTNYTGRPTLCSAVWSKLPAWKVGFEPHSGLQVSKKQNNSSPLAR